MLAVRGVGPLYTTCSLDLRTCAAHPTKKKKQTIHSEQVVQRFPRLSLQSCKVSSSKGVPAVRAPQVLPGGACRSSPASAVCLPDCRAWTRTRIRPPRLEFQESQALTCQALVGAPARKDAQQ